MESSEANVMRKMRYVLALALAAAMLLCAPCALAQSAVVDNGSDPGSRLNMRSAPGKDAGSLGKFVSGTRVEILSEAGDGWAKVSIGGGKNSVTGYMMQDYLRSSSAVDATKARRVVSPYGTPSVVLRNRPSNSYDAVCMLAVGDTVTQIGVSGDFCYVMAADGTVGCLLSSELK